MTSALLTHFGAGLTVGLKSRLRPAHRGYAIVMPKTTKGGNAKKSEIPSTLQRSEPKAQRTFAKAHDSAVEEYGEGERAHRVAYAALKHSYEKVGDHWEPKDD